MEENDKYEKFLGRENLALRATAIMKINWILNVT